MSPETSLLSDLRDLVERWRAEDFTTSRGAAAHEHAEELATVLDRAERHECEPPQRDPEQRSSASERRWDCASCGSRWIFVQRMIGRRMRGEWRRMRPTRTTGLPT